MWTHRAPSAEEKLYFSQNIYKISSKDLGQVVTTLEEKCPKALDKVRNLCWLRTSLGVAAEQSVRVRSVAPERSG